MEVCLDGTLQGRSPCWLGLFAGHGMHIAGACRALRVKAEFRHRGTMLAPALSTDREQHAHTHTNTNAHANTHRHAHTHKHTDTHTHTLTRTHAHTYTCTHTRTHTHPHAHMHMHAHVARVMGQFFSVVSDAPTLVAYVCVSVPNQITLIPSTCQKN